MMVNDIKRRESKQGKRRLIDAQRILEKAVDAMDLGITIVDEEGKILYVNRADAEMHGYSVDELLGRKASIFGADPESSPPDQSPPSEIKHWERTTVNVRKDGTEIPVRLISDQVTDESGNSVGVFTITEDLSEQVGVERMKEEFLSIVSHELRTPLTSIVASLSLLEDSGFDPGPEQAKELASIAFRNSNRLLRLIDDLLDLQKLRMDKMRLEIGPIDVRPVIAAAVSEIEIQAVSQSVELIWKEPDEELMILADRSRLAQVLGNLLSNAIRYSSDDHSGEVEISVEFQGEHVRISVKDDGPGISDEYLKELFVPFSRGDPPKKQAPGTGLGLSIVRRLVEAMNGTIHVDTTVGVGSVFMVDIPLAERQPVLQI